MQSTHKGVVGPLEWHTVEGQYYIVPGKNRIKSYSVGKKYKKKNK